MSIISINGTALPDPSSMSVTIQSIDSDSTKRNENGVLQRDRVRDDVHKISLEWSAISATEAQTVLNAVSPSSFAASYPDPKTGGTTSSTMYVGDRSSKTINTGIGKRYNISFDLIEY